MSVVIIEEKSRAAAREAHRQKVLGGIKDAVSLDLEKVESESKAKAAEWLRENKLGQA